MRALCLLLLTVLAGMAFADSVSYKGYHVMTVGPFKSEEEVADIRAFVNLFERSNKVQLWTYPRGLKAFDVAVAPELVRFFKALLGNMQHEVHSTNLQQWIDEEWRVNEAQRLARLARNGDAMPFEAPEEYMQFDQVVSWTRNLASQHANARVEELPTNTFEGRTIIAMKIGSHDGSKRKIWVDCGIHAREWISPATCIWIMAKMLNEYGTNADARYMVDNYDWIWIPVANPDGYVYSFSDDRLWRKTRTIDEGGSGCRGVDPNRNWAAYWGTFGISMDPCSPIYCGPQVWSEPSVRALRDYFNANNQNLAAFITVHSFTQFWLVPFAYSFDAPPPSNDAEIRSVGQATCDAIQGVNGRLFAVGTPPETLLSEASGSSMDWAKLEGIRYTYAPELRPATAEEGGFILPPVPHIRESGEEIFAGFAAKCRQM